MYPREQYLKEIISKKDNGRIKIITGLRRSGKSVLLFQLYREWLLGEGVKEDQIIALALDILENAKYRNPLELDKYVREHMINPKKKLTRAERRLKKRIHRFNMLYIQYPYQRMLSPSSMLSRVTVIK